jgi:hypothetical protein
MQWLFSAIHHEPGFRLAEGALPGRDRDRGLSFVNILLEYTPRFCSHLRSFVHCFFSPTGIKFWTRHMSFSTLLASKRTTLVPLAEGRILIINYPSYRAQRLKLKEEDQQEKN